MPMTPLMTHVANVMEAQFRPGLADFVEREYKNRSANRPTVERTKELVDACLNRMRLKLEECYDLKLQAGDVKNQCLLAIRIALADELDKEFPKPLVIAES